ncbi:MAG: transcriptional repressor [Dehalococcoidales bacterium]|nr:transcriptional repressor [Dehalococcoidales bacterium]
MIKRQEIIDILKLRGYKLTRQRRAILDTITRSHSHLVPAAVYEKANKRYPGIGLVTIYRTLELLARLGFICEVHSGNNRSYLMRRSSGHHHHLSCSICKKVTDSTDCDLSQMEEKIARQTDFKIDGHLVEFVGRCHDCRRKTNLVL